ncbi:MAG: serine/threonine protein kinase [Polyangiaceae bacterium]|nr:serine/threonine protein kinase [Polyangiaceae bacterium]
MVCGSFALPGRGQILDGRYQLESRIGEGTFGDVWRALDLRLGMAVAVKLAKDGVAVERFAEEVKLLASLQHPGVVTLRDQWDASTPGVRPYFVMEYCHSNIKEWIAERADIGGTDLEAVRAIFLDLCRAVAFVHEQGAIHRDLKPSNVLLLRDDHRFAPRLADFGVARLVPAHEGTATRGVGTDLYQSPEQGLMGGAPGPASDVFSLAVILFEMLTGEPTPEHGRPWWKIVAEAGVAPAGGAHPSVLEALRRALPDAAAEVIARALSLRPGDRPTAMELEEELHRAAREVRPAGHRRARSSRRPAARDCFPATIAVSNSLGYLFMVARPIFVDPKLETRIGYGARTYPHAWLVLPLSGVVLVGTLLAFRYVNMPRRWWLALVPFLAASAATLPILMPEFPHGVIMADTPVWLAFTGLWLAAHYSFNVREAPRSERRDPQERRLLFVLLVGALLMVAIAPIPMMLFISRVIEAIIEDPVEVSIVNNWTFFQVASWAVLWLVGPTREIGVAWLRALRSDPAP